MKWIARLITTYFILCVSNNVLAAGLGRLNLSSVLGEPLKAQIEIIGELEDGVSPELADSQEFSQVGIEYSPDLDDVKLKLIQINNRKFIKITTTNNFSEPVLNIIIKLVNKDKEQILQKNYSKFIELGNHNRVNTAKLTETNANPIAESIYVDDADAGIIKNTNNKNDSSIKISDNQKIQNEESLNSDDENNNENNAEFSNTVYVNKNSITSKKHINKKESSGVIKKTSNINKITKIKINDKNQLDNLPLSSQISLQLNDTKISTNVDKTPTIEVEKENKPTLTLDSKSALEILMEKNAANAINLSASETATLSAASNTEFSINNANASNTNIGLNIHNIDRMNITNDNQPNSLTDNNASAVKLNYKNKQKDQENSLFSIVKNYSIQSNAFLISILSIFTILIILLLSTFIYIIYMKYSYSKNLLFNKVQFDILQQQIIDINSVNNDDNLNENQQNINEEIKEKHEQVFIKRRKKNRSFLG